MKLIDSKYLTPDGVFNEMRERHKKSMIRNKFLAPFYIRKDLERNYPNVDISKYISEIQAEVANEINSTIHR